MKMEVFCGWGDGPDVGINLERTEEEARGYARPDKHWFLDFTAAEARLLAARLISCAEGAEKLDKSYAEYCEHMQGADGSCARCEGT